MGVARVLANSSSCLVYRSANSSSRADRCSLLHMVRMSALKPVPAGSGTISQVLTVLGTEADHVQTVLSFF